MIIVMTKQQNFVYEEYLDQIKKVPLAKKVKIADMLANLSEHPSERQTVR